MVATELDARRERRINLYDVLQVSASACPEVVQAAYRALARAYHPDVNPSPEAARQMRQLNAAYGVLSDPEKRSRYDSVRARPMRARHETIRVAQMTNEVGGRPGPTVMRPVPKGLSAPLPRAQARFGRVLLALAFVLLLIGALVYGVWLAAGALEEEPKRAMMPSSPDVAPIVVVDTR